MPKKQLFFYSPDESGGSGGGSDDPGAEGSGEGQPGTGEDTGREATGDTVPRSEYDKVKSEAARRRKEATDLKAQLKTAEDKSKSEIEKVNERLSTLEGDLSGERTTNRDLRAQSLAEEVGVFGKAREDAVKLLDWDKIEDPRDDGQVVAAFEELVKERPYLLGNVPAGADGGARGGSSEKKSMNDLIRESAGAGPSTPR